MGSLRNEYARVLTDEPLRKYLYEHHITPENYHAREKELMAMFPSPKAWEAFFREYLTPSALTSPQAVRKLKAQELSEN